MNTKTQYYKGIPIKLIIRNYEHLKAFRYTINGTKQNVWIPKKHCNSEGTLYPTENIDYVFRKANKQLEYAGIWQAIQGVKCRTVVTDEIIERFKNSGGIYNEN